MAEQGRAIDEPMFVISDTLCFRAIPGRSGGCGVHGAQIVSARPPDPDRTLRVSIRKGRAQTMANRSNMWKKVDEAPALATIPAPIVKAIRGGAGGGVGRDAVVRGGI